jgi:hypothetical protein
MRYQDLLTFIEHKMDLRHVYQPVLISALLEATGTATLRQLALALLETDENAITSAEARLLDLPLRKVLQKHGVVSSPAPGLWRLEVEPLTHQQRAALLAACQRRLADFLDKNSPWASTSTGIKHGTPYIVFQKGLPSLRLTGSPAGVGGRRTTGRSGAASSPSPAGRGMKHGMNCSGSRRP